MVDKRAGRPCRLLGSGANKSAGRARFSAFFNNSTFLRAKASCSFDIFFFVNIEYQENQKEKSCYDFYIKSSVKSNGQEMNKGQKKTDGKE